MLRDIHTTLRRLLYERGHISEYEVDISFEAPTRERVDRLTQPTLSLFLFALQENTELRQNGFQTTMHEGRVERRIAPRRFDLRYMISALTDNIEDEHQLLWRALHTLIQYQQLPSELQSAELRALETPLVAQIGQIDEGQRLSELWNALGVPPHPALSYVVTIPVDMNLLIEAPLVLTRTTRYTRKDTNRTATELGRLIGGVVRNEDGVGLSGIHVSMEGRDAIQCITDHEGRFTLQGIPSGSVKLRVAQQHEAPKIVEVTVPPPTGDRQNGALPAYDIILAATRPANY